MFTPGCEVFGGQLTQESGMGLPAVAAYTVLP